MRLWRWVLVSLGWLTLMSAGMAALLLAVDGQEVSRAAVFELERLLAPMLESSQMPLALTVGCWAVGVVLLVMAAFALASPFGRVRRSHVLEFPSGSGTVQVDISALEQCIAHMVSEEEGVLQAKVRLRKASRSRTPLGCTAEVTLEAGPNVLGKAAAIEERMRAYYYQVLPVKEEVRMDVRTKLVFRRSGARSVEARERGQSVRSATAEATDSPGHNYSGPRYPAVGDASDSERESV